MPGLKHNRRLRNSSPGGQKGASIPSELCSQFFRPKVSVHVTLCSQVFVKPKTQNWALSIRTIVVCVPSSEFLHAQKLRARSSGSAELQGALKPIVWEDENQRWLKNIFLHLGELGTGLTISTIQRSLQAALTYSGCHYPKQAITQLEIVRVLSALAMPHT